MSSPFGFGGDSSTSTSVITKTLGEAAQEVHNSDLAQGGGTLIKDSSFAPVIDARRGSTVNYTAGVDQAGLTSLLGNLTTATNDQISAASESQANQLSALAELLAQKTDTEAGNPSWLGWVALAAMAALALILFRK